MTLLTVLAFLRANWRLFAIAGAVLAVLGAVWGFGAHERHVQKAADQKVITALKDDLKTCRANNKTLDDARKAQNAATEALKSETERRAKMLSDGLQAARKTALAAQSRADRVLSVKVGGGRCADLDAIDRAISGG